MACQAECLSARSGNPCGSQSILRVNFDKFAHIARMVTTSDNRGDAHFERNMFLDGLTGYFDQKRISRFVFFFGLGFGVFY